MTVKILRKKSKPFPGDEPGELIPYFWYKGQKAGSDSIIEIGSSQDFAIDSEVDVLLEERENSKGRKWYSVVA